MWSIQKPATRSGPLGSQPMLKFDPTPTMDFETFSEVDVKKVGAFRYATDPSTEVLCLAFDLCDGKGVQEWFPDMGAPPTPLVEHIKAGGIVAAHNAEFEFAVWQYCCRRKYGFPPIELPQLHCTAAKGAALSLPRDLDGLSNALDASVKKDKEGHRLMLKMSRPRKPTKTNPSTRHNDWDDFEKLMAYCADDVRSEMASDVLMLPLSSSEQKMWELTTRINERGIFCDLPNVKTAMGFAKQFENELLEELKELTNGEVRTAKQIEALRLWLCNNSKIHFENVQAKTIRDTLGQIERGELHERPSEKVIRVLEIRSLLGKSSITKLVRMVQMAGLDARIRGTLLYHGAGTGRWAGRGIQPQNFPRGDVKDWETLFDVLEMGDFEFFKTLYPDVFGALASSLRGMLCAPETKEFLAADFSAIEARVLFWVAQEDTGLSLYYNNEDPYVAMAAVIFGVPISKVTKEMRQLGKQAVLGCGYGMGAPKFQATCLGYDMDVSLDLAKKAVEAYRYKFPNVKAFWYALESAMRVCIQQKKTTQCGRIKFQMRGKFCQMVLPSGRRISYYQPRVDLVQSPWGPKGQISYMSVNSQTRKFMREKTYGGKIVENCVQGIARDVMAEAMWRVEHSGAPVVTTVHDEVVSEIEKGAMTLKKFEELMARAPKWADGLPLQVEGWQGKRFRK